MSTHEDTELNTVDDEFELAVDQDNENEFQDNENEVQAGDEGNEEQDEDKKIVKPKRIVRNPQVKLNDATLRSAKGLTAIQGYFDKVKFRGKGYEDQDLNVLMKTYEYWCHRMFPKYPFDACIDKLESLGSKKATQTYLKRIRMDLIMDENKIEEDKQGDEIPTGDFVDPVETDNNSQFSQLLSSASDNVSKPIQFTEEQLDRMRQNRERAEKIRQERMQRIRDKAANSMEDSSFLASSSGLTSQSVTGSSKRSDVVGDIEVDSILNEINESNNISSGNVNKITFDAEKNIVSSNSDDEEVTATTQNRKNKRLVIDDDEEENSDGCNDDGKNSNGDVDEEKCIESMLNDINGHRNSVDEENCEANTEHLSQSASMKSVDKIDGGSFKENRCIESAETGGKDSEDLMEI